MQPARPALQRGAGAVQPSRRRAYLRTAANTTGTRLIPSTGSSEASSSAGAGAPQSAGASTAVAPASDLQTRQLRLLPWQTSASVDAAPQGSSSDSSSGDSALSSINAASPSGSNGGTIRKRAGQPTSVAASGSSGAASSATSSVDAGDGGSGTVRLSARATCEVCSGKRIVQTTRGVQPCPACQQWRQRPDYRAGGPLLTLQDFNLADLDGAGSGSGSSSSSSEDDSMLTGSSGKSGMPSAGAGASPPKPRRKSGPMSAERRRAISRALQSKGAKSEEHKRSISRAMREAHARNPQLRHSAAGQKKKCGYCGQEGHNRKTCPERLAAVVAAEAEAGSVVVASMADTTAGSGGVQQTGGVGGGAAVPAAAAAMGGSKMIVIEEVDGDAVPLLQPPAAAAAQSDVAATAALGAGSISSTASVTAAAAAAELSPAATLAADQAVSASSITSQATTTAESVTSNSAPPASNAAAAAAAAGAGSDGSSPTAQDSVKAGAAHSPATPSSPPSVRGSFGDLLPTVRLAPGMALSPEGGWVFPLPHSKEECVAQAAQAVLRAWDDGIRRQALELLLPQAHPTEDGGWPGGIRQQFRVAKPMVESLLLRLREHQGLEGRITAELLDEADCVGAWQSERLGTVLFATADTLPDLRRIDDALSGNRLTLVINPQWQTKGQVISDFGIGRARKNAERFVAAFEETYYLRRVRVFGDDVRIMRCYPGQWQVHYVPPEPGAETVLLSCEDGKPTFQRLIEVLKAVRGSRASQTWLDRFLGSSRGTLSDLATFSPEAAAGAYSSGSYSGSGGSSGSGEEALWPNSSALSATAPAAGSTRAGLAGPANPTAGSPGSYSTGAAGQAADGAASTHGSAAAIAGAGPALERDIVTGEVLHTKEGQGSSSSTSSASVRTSTTGSTSAASMRLQPVRDVRLEPVNQIARWLGSQPGASSSGEQRHDDST